MGWGQALQPGQRGLGVSRAQWLGDSCLARCVRFLGYGGEDGSFWQIPSQWPCARCLEGSKHTDMLQELTKHVIHKCIAADVFDRQAGKGIKHVARFHKERKSTTWANSLRHPRHVIHNAPTRTERWRRDRIWVFPALAGPGQSRSLLSHGNFCLTWQVMGDKVTPYHKSPSRTQGKTLGLDHEWVTFFAR